MGKTEDERKLIQFRAKPDTVRRIEQWYEADGCRSRNEFIERAVNFYADYLISKDDSGLLPAAIKSYIDGRLGMFEKHMASLLYKLSVEVDTVSTINAHAYEFDEDTLRRLRANSVRNVKQVNGILSFEQHVHDKEMEDTAWHD